MLNDTWNNPFADCIAHRSWRRAARHQAQCMPRGADALGGYSDNPARPPPTFPFRANDGGRARPIRAHVADNWLWTHPAKADSAARSCHTDEISSVPRRKDTIAGAPRHLPVTRSGVGIARALAMGLLNCPGVSPVF